MLWTGLFPLNARAVTPTSVVLRGRQLPEDFDLTVRYISGIDQAVHAQDIFRCRVMSSDVLGLY